MPMALVHTFCIDQTYSSIVRCKSLLSVLAGSAIPYPHFFIMRSVFLP
jgi:hypothetical protein